MASGKQHGDHAYIVARQERYIEAYRSGETDAIMQFMDPTELVYSDFAGQREGLKHNTVKEHFKNVFDNFYDLEIRTLSLHGHQHFTAWEWEITCRPAIVEGGGERLSREEALQRRMIGCTLMWWNDDDKIVRNHDYAQLRDP